MSKIAQQKAALTREIKLLETYIDDLLSVRTNNALSWYYLGDVITIWRVRMLQEELKQLKQERENLNIIKH